MIESTIILLLALTALELLYIAAARRLHIGAQRHNKHFVPVGGGIIFFIGALLPLFTGIAIPCQLTAILCGGALLWAISFIDDLRGLSPMVRLIVQFITVAVMLVPIIHQDNYDYYLPALFFIVGYMNSSNFMDGINGMLAAYGLVVAATLYYACGSIEAPFWLSDHDEVMNSIRYMSLGLMAAIVVFSFFNFRRKAAIFSGDVGSISLGYLLATGIAAIAIYYRCPSVIIIVGVYLIDTFCTFFQRLLNGEHVLTPHQKHLYQLLVRRGAQPLAVSGGYALTQLAVNVGWLLMPSNLKNIYATLVALLLTAVFISLRDRVTKFRKHR